MGLSLEAAIDETREFAIRNKKRLKLYHLGAKADDFKGLIGFSCDTSCHIPSGEGQDGPQPELIATVLSFIIENDLDHNIIPDDNSSLEGSVWGHYFLDLLSSKISFILKHILISTIFMTYQFYKELLSTLSLVIKFRSLTVQFFRPFFFQTTPGT